MNIDVNNFTKGIRDLIKDDEHDQFDNILLRFSKYNVQKAITDHVAELNVNINELNIISFSRDITKRFIREHAVANSVHEYIFWHYPYEANTTIRLRYPERGSLILVDWIRTTPVETIKPEPKQLKVRTIKTSEHTECPITCADIETKCTTNCGHVFEHSALLKALEHSETCPVCRAEVNIIIL
jgi:hypothetical protein